MGEKRYNSKACRACGAVTSVLLVERLDNVKDEKYGWVYRFRAADDSVVLFSLGRAIVACRGCGEARWALPVNGKLVEGKKCDARCTGAKGHNCECSCGGKNHGANHAA